MANLFSSLEATWLRATKRSFEWKDLTDILDHGKRKDLFVSELKKVLSRTFQEKSQLFELVDKIDKMPTDELCALYRRDFHMVG